MESLNARIRSLTEVLEEGLFERSEALRLSLLCAIAGESVFLLGPPGTAKSLLARRLRFCFAEARFFDYLMGRFSTPEEIFGPVSIKKLREEDRHVRNTEAYLPRADIVFLDEIWKAAPPIQNALLTALNEKIYRNGDEETRLPLKLLLGASNEVPQDDTSLAFWDRFLLRLNFAPLKDPDNFVALLKDTGSPSADPVPPALKIKPAEWEAWQKKVDRTALSDELLGLLLKLRAKLAEEAEKNSTLKNLSVSDRRWKKIARLLKASALCHDRDEAGPVDLAVLVNALWSRADEIPAVTSLVSALVEEEAFAKSPEDLLLEKAAKDFRTKRDLLDKKEVSREEERGLLVDEEYYELEGFETEGPFRDIPQGASLKIWKTDYEALAAAPGREGKTEFFVFREGAFERSLPLNCRVEPGRPWMLKSGGLELKLKTRRERVLAYESFSPDPAREAELENERKRLLESCETRAVERLGASEELDREGKIQLFWFPAFEGALRAALARRIKELADLAALLAPRGGF